MQQAPSIEVTTVTAKIQQAETLFRLFYVDATLDVIRALPETDPRRAQLLKYWGQHRQMLSLAPEIPGRA